jgi:hypothetical protein
MVAIPNVLFAPKAEKLIVDASVGRREMDLIRVGTHQNIVTNSVAIAAIFSTRDRRLLETRAS